jgi:enoyl-CoA hydratase/carnithine racemase
MTSDYRFLEVETRDRVAYATLNGSDDLNRWPPDTEWELIDITRKVAANDEIRALVLTGAGDAFSSGVGHAAGSFDPFEFYDRARELVYAYINLDKPVIMALNGPAAGGGLTLALTGDIIIAERHLTFADAHVLGGIVSATGPYLWPRSTGLLQAKRYLLTGDAFDAETAAQIGLVTEVVDTGKALTRATEFAQKFAAMPGGGVAGTKRALNQWMRRASAEIFDHGLAQEFMRFPVSSFEAMIGGTDPKEAGKKAR